MRNKLTQKGQVTIPAQFRKQYGLQPGDQIEFKSRKNELVLIKKRNKINDAFGLIKVKSKVSLKDIQNAIESGSLDDSN